MPAQLFNLAEALCPLLLAHELIEGYRRIFCLG